MKLNTLWSGAEASLKPLRPRQEKAISDLRQAIREGHRRIVLQMPTGGGKCLAKGTPVLMFDGSIRAVETVRVNDVLMGPDSEPRIVRSLSRGSEELFRIVPVKGDPFTVNRSHILSLKISPSGNQYPCRRSRIVNISVDEYLSSSRYFKHTAKIWRTGVEWPCANSSPLFLSPYFLGVWLGDGTSSNASVTTADKEVVDYLYEYDADLSLGILVQENSINSKVYHLTTGKLSGRAKRNVILNELKSLDLICNKHIPRRYLLGSREERLQLLAGIIDADGSLSKNACFDLCLKSERLMDDVVFLCRSLGFAAYKSKCVKTCTNNGKAGVYFRCNITGDIDQVPCLISRKQSGPRRQKKNPLVTGFKVESVGVGEYYGFEIEGPDRLFLLGDFTVTHNTIVAAHIIANALEKGKRPLFACPAINLVNQTVERLEQNGIGDIGVIQSDHERTDIYAPVQVASIQTLVRRGIPPADIVIYDECHLNFQGMWEVLDREDWKDVIVIGLSATPWAKGMGRRWTKLVMAGTVRDLIEEKWLVDFIGFGPADRFEVDTSNVKVLPTGEFEDESAALVVNKPEIVANVVDEWLEKGPGDKTFIFAQNRAHAETIQRQFYERGISCAYMDAYTDREARSEIFRKYRLGEYQLIASVGTLTTGVDEEVKCIILARLIRSEITYVQIVGRGLRLGHEGKVLTILDHGGNAQRLGLVTDIHHEKLDTRGPREKGDAYQDEKPTPKPRKCSQCNALIKSRVCPNCGKEQAIISEVEHVPGELVEYGSKKKSTKKVAFTPADKARFYAELLGYAEYHNRSQKWALANYRERFQEWPYRSRDVQPAAPSSETESWVRSRMIRYAKAKEKEAKSL